MVTEKKNRILKVLMNGMIVGYWEKSIKGALTYTYDKIWLNTSGARPISLSLPLIDRTYSGDIVYNFFDNLLPDNPQIRSRIQAKFNASTSQPFDLLAKIGKDCVGAIQIIEDENYIFKKQIEYEVLTSEKIANILQNYQYFPLGMQDSLSEFRISIAGAQEKSAFLYYNNKWNLPQGETPTSHIFKLPIGYITHQELDLSDSCENEWLCSQIAAAFGLEVAKCEILHFKDVKVLVVERFDRKLSSDKKWLMRLPQEDFCQALGVSPNLKYETDGGPGLKEIMNVLQGSENASNDQDAFFRAQVLFWLLAAIDGHAKNFSLFIEPEGKYRLTPLYDIMSAYPLIAKKQLQAQKIKMAMALKGKNVHYHWHNIQRRHFIESAKIMNYSMEKAEAILDEMLSQVDSVIKMISSILPATFPKNLASSIFEGMSLMKRKLSKSKQ